MLYVGTWNVAGWTDNNEYLRKAILYELNGDIIGIQETHLSDNKNSQPNLEGYNWIGHCREKRHIKSKRTHGGVGVFIKKSLYEIYNISIIDNSYEGILGILFKDKVSEYCFTVFCCYLPPENSPHGRDSNAFFTHLLSMRYLHSYVDSFFILGDFNSRVSDKKDSISAIDPVIDRNTIDFTLNKHGESFLDFLKESCMVVTNGRVNGKNNFTSISSKGKSVVDFVVIPIENIEECINCDVHLVSEMIEDNNFESFISEKCKPPDHSPIILSFKPKIIHDLNAEDTSHPINMSSKRYKYDTMSNEFLHNDTWKFVLNSLISGLNHMDTNQNSIDEFYDNMIVQIFEEMDKHIGYKDATKSTRKRLRNHKPFWTDELTEAWRDMSIAEKDYIKVKHSYTYNKNLRSRFISKRKYFDKILRRTERAYNRKKSIEIETINTENPTEFWKQIGALGPKRSCKIPFEVYDDNGPDVGNKITDEKVVLDRWRHDFSQLYNMPSEMNSSFDSDFFEQIMSTLPEIKRFELENTDANSHSYNSPFTLEELNKICMKLKQNKAVGPDMIPNEILKRDGIRKLLLRFINYCFLNNVIPSVWRKSLITPIPKSSSKDPYIPLNYRGISLLSCMYKLYSSCLNSRLSYYCEMNDYLVDEQNGFRPKRSCQDHVYALSSIIRNRKSKGLSTYCAFVDFQKAFDWVSRDLLLYKLATTFDIHGRLFNNLSNVYSSSSAQIRLNGKLSSSFDVISGVKQGDIISPILFSMYLNDLATGIKDLNCGIDINGFICSILLYADDIVLIAPDEESLQKMLDFINQWCNKWRMGINTGKTQVIHFRPSRTPQTNFNFRFGTNSLTIVSVYKYLGVLFDEFLSFDNNASALADAACRALGAIRSKVQYIKPCGYKTFDTLFNSGVISIADYSAAIWGTKSFPKIEQVSYKAARYFLGVHRFAPVEALLGDMGWSSARNRHKLLMLKFWNRLCRLPESRVTRKIFEWDKQFSSIRGTWSFTVKQLFNELEQPTLFNDASLCDPESAQNTLTITDTNNWDLNRYKSDKLRYYNLYKYEKSPEDYLFLDISPYQRSVFSQFRCGILPLEIEVGRYRDAPLNERICQVCNQAVEDEIHFLLTCHAYAGPRKELITKAIHFDESFNSLDEIEQFVFLVSNLQRPVIKYLTKALHIRTHYLNHFTEN